MDKNILLFGNITFTFDEDVIINNICKMDVEEIRNLIRLCTREKNQFYGSNTVFSRCDNVFSFVYYDDNSILHLISTKASDIDISNLIRRLWIALPITHPHRSHHLSIMKEHYTYMLDLIDRKT